MAETEAIRGVITKGVGGVYTVRFFNEGSYEYVQCAARGAFRLKGIKPAIGDRVSIMSSGDPDVPYVITDIENRTSFIARPPGQSVYNAADFLCHESRTGSYIAR